MYFVNKEIPTFPRTLCNHINISTIPTISNQYEFLHYNNLTFHTYLIKILQFTFKLRLIVILISRVTITNQSTILLCQDEGWTPATFHTKTSLYWTSRDAKTYWNCHTCVYSLHPIKAFKVKAFDDQRGRVAIFQFAFFHFSMYCICVGRVHR